MTFTPFSTTGFSYVNPSDVETLLNELFGRLSSEVVSTKQGKVVENENDNTFTVTAAIPGAKREDVFLTLKYNVFFVGYNPKTPNPLASAFTRSYDTKGLDMDSVAATYVDGVLTVTVQKLKKKEPTVKTYSVM
jgi:HSP20 family molecular chaperone IbpA